MESSIVIALITTIGSVLTALVAAIMGLTLSNRKTIREAKDIASDTQQSVIRLKVEVDGRMSELLEKTSEAAHLSGISVERQKAIERAIIVAKESAKELTEAELRTPPHIAVDQMVVETARVADETQRIADAAEKAKENQ